MRVGWLKKKLEDMNNKAEVLVFVKMPNGDYVPFKNIKFSNINGNSKYGSVHFDVSVDTEFKSIHFPDNLSEDEVGDLFEQRTMLLEELEEIEEMLGGFLE